VSAGKPGFTLLQIQLSSGYQTGAALGASGIDDLAAAPGGHACAETVGSDALEVAWLKGSFHFYLPG